MSLKAHPKFRLHIFHKIALLGLLGMLGMLLLGGIDYRDTVHIDNAERTCQHGKVSAVVAKEGHNLDARSARRHRRPAS